MFGRRILVLVAVLMGLTALAASLAPPPPAGRQGAIEGGPSPTATPSAAAAPPGDGATVSARLSAGTPAGPREVSAVRGDLVNLTVSGNVIDTVAIGGLPVLEPIAPDSPARVELYADKAGRFPIRLLDAGRRIGTLQVSG
jgi:hypothetical protein